MRYFSITFILIIFLHVSCTRDALVPNSINNCDERTIYFERDLFPVIVSSCATSGCHANKNPEDGIRLHNISNILKYVKKGNPEDSELYKYLSGVINSNDEDAMPPSPNQPLTEEQITDIYNWIKTDAQLFECNKDCDKGDVTFNFNIGPIMQKYCVGCHSSANATANVRLDKYSKIKQYVLNGELMGTINHTTGFSIMPPGTIRVSDCEIQELQQWINEGALDN